MMILNMIFANLMFKVQVQMRISNVQLKILVMLQLLNSKLKIVQGTDSHNQVKRLGVVFKCTHIKSSLKQMSNNFTDLQLKFEISTFCQ